MLWWWSEVETRELAEGRDASGRGGASFHSIAWEPREVQTGLYPAVVKGRTPDQRSFQRPVLTYPKFQPAQVAY